MEGGISNTYLRPSLPVPMSELQWRFALPDEQEPR